MNRQMHICTVEHMDTEKPRKKRLIVELDLADDSAIKDEAEHKEMSVSNYVRYMLELPLERQGVKRPDPPSKSKRARTSKGSPC